MDAEILRWLLAAHAFITLFMTGLVWFVQVVHYRPEFYLGLNFPWDVFFEIPEWYARHNARAAVPGRIVVFHDNQDRREGRGAIINQSRRTLAALPVLLAELEKQGFEARSLAEVESSINR